MKRIVCFHLLNDFSGSPKVLSMVLKGLLERGYQVDLISSHGGVLDTLENCPNLKKYSYCYTFSNNGMITMLRYTAVQLYTFFLAFRYLFTGNCVFYINTLLPIGPALAGRIMGKRVIYHYHENAFVKGAFYRILAWAMQRLAHEIVCVSAYQASFLKRKKKIEIIPNAFPQEFANRLHPNPKEAFRRKNILMLSSLKEYKGTREFIELAKRLPRFNFILVINDTQENIDIYLKQVAFSYTLQNLSIYSRQMNVTSFYNTGTLVLNLSDKLRFIETFGLTALEAMAAGLPVIVPTEGGIAELVENGKNGYKIDVQELDKIAEHIETMLEDEKTYLALATGALEYARRFQENEMVDSMARILS